MHRTTVHTALIAGFAVAAAFAIAGPLNPPAGPVAPTFKTLAEVEPRIAIGDANTPGDTDSVFRITQPGSYYLTGNVSGAPGKHGIQVETAAAGGVTLDLCGFTLDGTVPAGSSATLSGIAVSSVYARVTVRNGTLRGWGGSGLSGAVSAGCVVELVRATNNSVSGILAGGQSVVTACTASDNAMYGIRVGAGGVVERCTVEGNQDGIFTDSSCVVRGCAAFFNSAGGIVAGSHTLVEACSAGNNWGDGIRCGANARVIGNICNVNALAGVHATMGGNHLEHNTVEGNERGIDVDDVGNFIARNTATSNTTNFAITGAQTIGPIITATGTIATTSPWANFAF